MCNRLFVLFFVLLFSLIFDRDMCDVFVCEIRVGQPSAKIVVPSVEELKYFKTSYGGFGPSWVFG